VQWLYIGVMLIREGVDMNYVYKIIKLNFFLWLYIE